MITDVDGVLTDGGIYFDANGECFKRFHDLGVTLCEFGVKDNSAACQSLMEQAWVSAVQTACIGDDSIALPAFSACGLSFAIADAPEYVKRQAMGVLAQPGGHGAFRELADAILEAQGMADVYCSAKGCKRVATGVAQ